MFEHVITYLSSSGFLSTISQNIDVVSNMFTGYFSGSNNLRIISIILIMLAVILFLFLIIVLYVKSIVVFLKNDAQAKKRPGYSFFSEMDNEDYDSYAKEKELEREREIEDELKRELEKKNNEEALSKEQRELARQQREDEAKEKALAEEIAEKKKEKEASAAVALDWQKGKMRDLEASSEALQSISLEYQQSKKNLNELLGLIIDMIGRGVDDLKIAQTIMYRNQGTSTEEDVLQTIDAVKDFIAMCINERFKGIRSQKKLPSEERALYNLANGDASLSLALIEALMHNNVNESLKLSLGPRRDAILKETSYNSVTFGSLASLSDIHLATSSFELSIELNPQNINAWGRLGDMYNIAESHKKAVWAYENLLKMADEELYPRQVANASKMLSKYHYEQGDSLEAAKLYNSSKSYYDSIGINRRLDRNELEIIEVIEARKDNDVESTVAKILQSKHLNQYSYAS